MGVGHAQADEVAAAQLAVDGGVEQGEVARAAIMLKACADFPNVPALEGWVGTDDAAKVLGTAECLSGRRYGEAPFEELPASHPVHDYALLQARSPAIGSTVPACPGRTFWSAALGHVRQAMFSPMRTGRTKHGNRDGSEAASAR